jgi:hypothetical protein
MCHLFKNCERKKFNLEVLELNKTLFFLADALGKLARLCFYLASFYCLAECLRVWLEKLFGIVKSYIGFPSCLKAVDLFSLLLMLQSNKLECF